MKKKYILSLLAVILLIISCDNIDNLNQIAGIESFEMVVIKPAKYDFYELGNDCLIQWELSKDKAKDVRLELVRYGEIIHIITTKTENDGEYVWEKINIDIDIICSIRLTIIEGPYSGKSCESAIFIIQKIHDQIICFYDINLEIAVREVIDKPYGIIYKNDVKDITQLYLRGEEVYNITGLEYFTSLQELSLSYNNITDITPLSGLSSLQGLSLDSNQIIDITSLSGLSSLHYLSLASNQIADITPLYDLSSLEWLNLDANPLNDNSISNIIPEFIEMGVSVSYCP